MHRFKSIIEYHDLDFGINSVSHNFEISDWVYRRIKSLRKKNIELSQDYIYDTLIELAEESFLHKNIIHGNGNISVMNVYLLDPEQLNNFKRQVIGRRLSSDRLPVGHREKEGKITIGFGYLSSCIQDNIIENYVTLVIDKENRIKDVFQVKAYISFLGDEEEERMPFIPSYKSIIRDIIDEDNKYKNQNLF